MVNSIYNGIAAIDGVGVITYFNKTAERIFDIPVHEAVRSNTELMEEAIRLAAEFDREPATPEEARRLLGLKGMDKVNF